MNDASLKGNISYIKMRLQGIGFSLLEISDKNIGDSEIQSEIMDQINSLESIIELMDKILNECENSTA